MEVAIGLAILPLLVAFFVIRKPRDGIVLLAPALVLVLTDALVAQYYQIDGCPQERAWLPACLAIYAGWVIFCTISAIALRAAFAAQADEGTGISPVGCR